MPLITKVELKNGTIYELGKTWPVKDQKEGSKGAFYVSLISLCPSESRQDDEGAESIPPKYQIWCAPKSLLQNFFTPVQLALFKNDPRELAAWSQQAVAEDLVKYNAIFCRNVWVSQTIGDEESWQTNDALTEVKESVIDTTFAPPEDEDDPEPEPDVAEPPVVPANGEQKSVEPAP